MYTPNFRRILFLTVFAGVALFFCQSSLANNPTLPEIWLFDSWSVSRSNPTEEQFEKIKVYRLQAEIVNGKRKWESSSFSEYYERGDVSKPTIVFIPGYKFTKQDSIDCGLILSNQVFRNRGDYRLVIWSWPAEQGSLLHLREDILQKSQYADTQGVYIAKFLRGFPRESRVSLVTFSLGARTVFEALERLRREQIREGVVRTVSSGSANMEQEGLQIRCRSLLLTPAIDQFVIASGQKYGMTLAAAEKTVVLYNPIDKALKYYPMLSSLCGGPAALGRAGAPWGHLTEGTRNRLEMLNVAPITGEEHRFAKYFKSPKMTQRLADFMFFEGDGDMDEEMTPNEDRNRQIGTNGLELPERY